MGPVGDPATAVMTPVPFLNLFFRYRQNVSTGCFSQKQAEEIYLGEVFGQFRRQDRFFRTFVKSKYAVLSQDDCRTARTICFNNRFSDIIRLVVRIWCHRNFAAENVCLSGCQTGYRNSGRGKSGGVRRVGMYDAAYTRNVSVEIDVMRPVHRRFLRAGNFFTVKI